jgi:hypothetical protein
VRQQLSLDGSWQFQIDPGGELAPGDIKEWRTIKVPGPWQAQFDDLRLVAGVGWYRRPVMIPAAWAGRAIFLRIGAADYFTEAWVNGQPVGQHEGGYLPFEFDLTPYVELGAENEIVIRVVDPGPREQDIFPDFPFAEIPHGKQSWYGPVGGIWQTVYSEARAPQWITQVHVTPESLTGRVAVAVRIQGSPENANLMLRCLSPGGQPVADFQVAAYQADVSASFQIDQPELWSPETPVLYTLEVTLRAGERGLDGQAVRFGVRTLEARGGQLYLNGRVFYLRGALDQDYYPEGIYTPPSLDFLRQQVRQAKAMGLNCLRCHIKIPDPRYLQAADEEGILIWSEVPSWGRLTERSGPRVRETFAGMVARDWNHPAIVIWTIVNENWGTDLVHSAGDRQWLAETVDWARQLDPTRLIVDNSPCSPNFHVKTDLDDFHFYSAMPEGMDRWQAFTQAFAGRPAFTFTPNGDGVRTGQEPLIVSEFGNWGLPDLAALRAAYGQRDPWWVETGKTWNPPVVWPQEAEKRFQEAGLAAAFGDWSGLAQAAQWAQFRALKYEIETLRAEPALSGYVITEWSDLHWECNGLVDMARNPRVFAGEMAAINADTVLIPRWDRLAYWSGETVEINFWVAHQGREALRGVEFAYTDLDGWHVSTSPTFDVPPGRVMWAGSISLKAPHVEEPAQFDLSARVTARGGQHVPSAAVSISVFNPMYALGLNPPIVWADDPDLRHWLTAQGYQTDERGLWITSHLDGRARHHLGQGGRVLLCATEPGEIVDGVQVWAREDTPWSGHWASSFAWICPGVSRVPGGPMLDFTWRGVFPAHVMTGIAPEHTLAGLFVGWVHQPAALIGHVPIGQGRLMVTTFPVVSLDNAPLRTILLHDLIRLADGTS